MKPSEAEAIAGGYHGDAFRVLGPHPAPRDGQEVWEVRAFLPQAQSAEVIAGDRVVPMRESRVAGFFLAEIGEHPGAYRLRMKRRDGEVIEQDDPYRFPLQLSDFDLYLHSEGTHYETYNTMGAHLTSCQDVSGVRFSVWAPNAEVVSVTGDFNDWDTRRHPMRLRQGGVWELFLPGVGAGAHYKYFVRGRQRGFRMMKVDPYAFAFEVPPKTASVVADLERYEWADRDWMEARAKKNWLREPVSIYEVHLGSWLRGPDHRVLAYRELADTLVAYVKHMGYTHIELLPVQEHPFSGSWGYQVIGYFAPTSRFGRPEDFMYFVDRCHQEGIGVLIDWVPAHFPKDAHGLAHFDGTALYEHEDPRQGEHADWGTLIFNFGRNEVRGFLISSAMFWLKKYHIDGLRVDAVASMLYLDYSRQAGEWIPNIHGGNENLEAIDFLRRFNEQAHHVPGAITIAEESTAFAGVSRPIHGGGLGFTMKWNMGWMHDMLDYFSKDPIHRKYHHKNITFSLLYAFNENFLLPISHDEVVHGKGSLIGRMPGDEWQRFANLRAFLAYMYGHPGKKLLFMGSEIGQYEEWNSESCLRWDLLQFEYHRKWQALVAELNRLYRAEPSLHEIDYHWAGFEWLDLHDVDASVISFLRRASAGGDFLVFVCNFTPVPRFGYRLGVPKPGPYEEILNTDSHLFGGSDLGNGGWTVAESVASHGRPASLSITLPPLAVVVFRRSGSR